MSGLGFDEGMARQLEVLYARRDVLRRRELVHAALDARHGERVLDVGCGPGFYVAELAEQVGPGGHVLGLDASADMVAVAAARCDGLPNAEVRRAEATALPVDDGTFDAAISVQVLEYVDDATAALRELHRALRPGGRAVVWDVDWATVSWHSSDPERMRRVLAAWDRHLVHPALPLTLAPRLRAAGFADVRAEPHAFGTVELTPEAYGGAILPLVEAFVAGRGGLTGDEARAWAAEQEALGDRGEFAFACVQWCFTATRPAP